MHREDALIVVTNWLRSKSPGDLTRLSHYGYDLYIPTLIRWYYQRNPVSRSSFTENQALTELFPAFADAAWELCRRGILRPGVSEWQGQSTDEGSAGSGFSVTPFGRMWLAEGETDTFVPTEPERFAQLLEPLAGRFGQGFKQRSQEAVRCYGAHAYVACCAMCGAAAESILLATATEKTGNVDQVLKTYMSARGRRELRNIIVGQASGQVKGELEGLIELLKYWRDEAAHGAASDISDQEAFTSLAVLLRYGKFVSDNWLVITAS